jgi:hypothetical protein
MSSRTRGRPPELTVQGAETKDPYHGDGRLPGADTRRRPAGDRQRGEVSVGLLRYFPANRRSSRLLRRPVRPTSPASRGHTTRTRRPLHLPLRTTRLHARAHRVALRTSRFWSGIRRVCSQSGPPFHAPASPIFEVQCSGDRCAGRCCSSRPASVPNPPRRPLVLAFQ